MRHVDRTTLLPLNNIWFFKTKASEILDCHLRYSKKITWKRECRHHKLSPQLKLTWSVKVPQHHKWKPATIHSFTKYLNTNGWKTACTLQNTNQFNWKLQMFHIKFHTDRSIYANSLSKWIRASNRASRMQIGNHSPQINEM